MGRSKPHNPKKKKDKKKRKKGSSQSSSSSEDSVHAEVVGIAATFGMQLRWQPASDTFSSVMQSIEMQ